MKRWKRFLLLGFVFILLTGCTANHSESYRRALDIFASGEYEEAAQAFEKLGDYQQSAQYAAYSRGLVLWEQGDYLNAEPYFEQCQTLLMGGQRYAYCHACALEAAGDAAGAAEAFGKLGDFEDAALHQYYNEGVDAENRKDYEKALYDYSAAGNVADASDRLLNLQGQIYNRAIELREERSYEEAIYLFTILGDYLSSARQAVECEQIFRDEQYSQADAMGPTIFFPR